MARDTAGPFSLTDTAPLQFPASSWPSPNQAGWVVVYNFSTNLIKTSFNGDDDFLAPYVAGLYDPNGQAFTLSTDTANGMGYIYLVYYSSDEPEPSGFPMALYVAPEGTPQPTLDAVSITGPLPLPIEQGPLTIIIETPPEGMKTVGYSFCLHAVGGTRPYTWSLPAGSLPTGLTLSPGGHVTGTTSAAGGSTAVFTVTDADGNTDTEAFGFVVLPLPSTYIEEIESTDGSITVTDPTGPTVDLATAGAYIKEITSIDGSVTVTDPTGPTVDLATAGGGGALEYIAFNEDVNWTSFPLGGWAAYETTPDLDVGTWLLTVQTNYVLNGTPSSAAAIRVIENSATATFVGPTRAGGGGPYSIQCDCLLTFTCIVKVAVKGTLDIQAQGNYRGQLVGWTAEGGGPATGYVAVRISPSAT